MSSKIMISGLKGPNMELAKNLTLKSLNLAIFDSEEIDEKHCEENFMLRKSDLSKKVKRSKKREEKLLQKN